MDEQGDADRAVVGRAELTRRWLLVSGLVQGVWFRDTTRTEAQRLGLAGWVRNRRDGRVEIEVEGPADAVDRLVAWAHGGPPRARVDSVVEECRAITGERGFDVRPTTAGPPQDRA